MFRIWLAVSPDLAHRLPMRRARIRQSLHTATRQAPNCSSTPLQPTLAVAIQLLVILRKPGRIY